MAGSCPPRAPTGPPQGAPQSPMLPAHRTRRRTSGSSGPPAAGGATIGQPQATQAKDDTGLLTPDTRARPGRIACRGGNRHGQVTERDELADIQHHRPALLREWPWNQTSAKLVRTAGMVARLPNAVQ